MVDCPCPHHPIGCFGHPATCKCAKSRLRRRLTISSEIIFGGIRLEPGTYDVQLVEQDQRDEQF